MQTRSYSESHTILSECNVTSKNAGCSEARGIMCHVTVTKVSFLSASASFEDGVLHGTGMSTTRLLVCLLLMFSLCRLLAHE